MRQKLFTKQVDDMLFKQYAFGNDLSKQKVVAKIFNPYGSGVWYLLNSDPTDPDYIWAIVDLFEIEVGSVSRESLEMMKVPPFGLNLERDMYFQPINAEELFQRVLQGERFAKGGELQIIKNESGENYLASGDSKPNEMTVKLAKGGGIFNGKYLDSISNDKKTKILKNIANHYGISVREAEDEVKDADAEMLYEYIANDQSLRMSIYNDIETDEYADGGGVENEILNTIKSLNGYWESYYKGVMSGKKDDGYVTIKNEEDLSNYINQKTGYIIKNIEVIEKGKTYPYNTSNPYYEDTYLVTLKNGTKFKVERSYGRPNWSGNVDYKEQIKISDINIKYADGGGVENYVFIALSKTKNGRLISERFDKQITHKELFDFYKKRGYEIIDSNIFKVTNKDVLDIFKDAISKFIKEKYNELVDWENSFLSYEIIGDRIIAQSSFVQTKNGNEYKITPNDLVNKKFNDGGMMAKGGSVNDDLDNFDIFKLDDFEYMQYNHFIEKSKVSKKEALEILINNVEGDYSQLSPKLRAIAKRHKMAEGGMMAKGGVTFDKKVSSISKSLLKRKKVSPSVQKDYGKTYNKSEAKDSAKRIVGSMTKMERAKKIASAMPKKKN